MFLARYLLRRHVSRGADQRSRDCETGVAVETLGETEVRDVRFASGLIERLAAGDTLGVSAAIKTWRVTVSPEDR